MCIALKFYLKTKVWAIRLDLLQLAGCVRYSINEGDVGTSHLSYLLIIVSYDFYILFMQFISVNSLCEFDVWPKHSTNYDPVRKLIGIKVNCVHK